MCIYLIYTYPHIKAEMDILRAENINNKSYYTDIKGTDKTNANDMYVTDSIFSFDDNLSNNIYGDSDIFEASNASDKNAESLKKDLEKTRDEQGLIGKLWDGFKNLTGIGAGSNKAEDAIKQYENGEITYEEAQEKLENYKKGQETAVDVAGDIVSGIVAVGAFALAVPTGGASLVAGLGFAAAAGAGTKIAVKAGDAIIGGRDYTAKDLLYDSATGAINGLFAPITNGVGACVTKTVGNKLGLTVVKEGTKEVIEQTAKQGIKSIITQQGVDVIGGTFLKRAAATAAGMAVDGAIGGSTDNMVRAALDGEDIEGVLQAGVEGAIGGLIMAPVIGGGFKAAGKLGKSLNNKITTKSVFSNGMDTVFKQGETGDCALLSFINGAMKSDDAQDLIKKSITKSAFGDYHVKIGNQTIDIPASSLTDDILSDTTGVKLFEAAYKKLGGSIDGEFAESVAKQFGLNPVHIASDSITDETLDKIAKEQGTILSFGTKIDADGNISTSGTNHYFSIQDVDTLGKKVTLTDPYDTSKLIELSYDDIKKFGISIDGGSVKETGLPNSVRNSGDISFKGNRATNATAIDAESYQQKIREFLASDKRFSEYTAKDIEDVIQAMNDGHFDYGVSEIEFQRIKNDAFREIFEQNNTLQIGKRKIFVTDSQRAKYESFLAQNRTSLPNEEYCMQLIMTDAMFIEAAGVNLGLDIQGKSAQEIFEMLQNYCLDETISYNEIFAGVKIADIDNIAETYFMRDALDETIEQVGDLSGDKAIHELNKALAQKFQDDPVFRSNWIKYCATSEKFRQYEALANAYKADLIEQISIQGNTSAQQAQRIISENIENQDHIIFRSLQRDAIADFESIGRTSFMDIEPKSADELTFTHLLAKKLIGGDITEEFMGRILNREGTNKFQTIIYNMPNWAYECQYVPHVS